VYRVKGYLTGQYPDIRRIEVDTLAQARAEAAKLKLKGFAVEIRDMAGNIIPDVRRTES
jgi:hypothetical protein